MQGRQQKTDSSVPKKGSSDSLPKGLFPAVVFTLAGIAAAIAFIREPSFAHGVQVGIAILLVSYCWYIVYNLNQTRKDQIQKWISYSHDGQVLTRRETGKVAASHLSSFPD